MGGFSPIGRAKEKKKRRKAEVSQQNRVKASQRIAEDGRATTEAMCSSWIMDPKFGFGVVQKVIEVNDEKAWNLQEIFVTANAVEKHVSC